MILTAENLTVPLLFTKNPTFIDIVANLDFCGEKQKIYTTSLSWMDVFLAIGDCI
jgi:hypothetical protein